MSDDDIEFISIDLDDKSGSEDGSIERRSRNRSRASVGSAETDYKHVDKLARNKRDTSQYSNGKSCKRSVKRKRQNLFESDDETAKKRVHKKRQCSSESDYEPSPRRVVKKLKCIPHSDKNSSEKRARKKHEGSAFYVEPVKKNTDLKSECLDSDKEEAQNSLREVSKAFAPRKRMKKTPMRKRASVDETDDTTSIPDKSCLSRDLDENHLNSDSEKPKNSSASDKEEAQNSSVEVSKAFVPRKRMKTTPMRKKTSVDETDDTTSIPDKSCLSRDLDENYLNSDSEKPKSSSASNKEEAQNSSVEVSKVFVPRKRMKTTPMRKRASVDETDDKSCLSPDLDENYLNSDSEKPKNSSAFDKERAQNSSVEASKEVAPRKRMKITAMRKFSVCVRDYFTTDKSCSSLDSDSEEPKSSSAADEGAQNSTVEVSKKVAPKKRTKKTPMRKRTFVDEVDDSISSPDESCSSLDCNENVNSDSEKPKSSSAEKVARMKKRLPEIEANSIETDGMDVSDQYQSCPDSNNEKAHSSSAEKSEAVAPMKKRSSQNEVNSDEEDDCMDVSDESNSCYDYDDDEDLNFDSNSVELGSSSEEAPMKKEVCEKEMNSADKSDNDFMTVPEISGFEFGLKAKRVIGVSDYGPGGIKCLIQFHGQDGAELVQMGKCRKYCPQLLLKFYEQNIVWTTSE